MKPIALVDMDDTLCAYSETIYADHLQLLAPSEEFPSYEEFFSHNTDGTYIEKRTKLIRKVPGWWLNLRKLNPGFRVLDMLRNYEYEIHILTKGPASTPNAWKEKVEWCQVHVSDAKIAVVSDKSLVYGKVLVDDFPEYIEMWLRHRPRALVIMPEYSWNKSYTHPQVLHLENTPESYNKIDYALKDIALKLKGADL